ncbi:VOC family protein [Staphylococcus simiae]|uniref:VOC family protein n=1 Tax=Staphylococcus simiae TaxID=308354 RepID=UPI001A963DAF|nr:VOC family protein [Staphylococcus simiae]MBO1200018.1 VOC family protein [Staphylococcus simiae]MBO1202295.1 VOC family protein [Staphylococcus simiae]MBO1204553.1 VOC family protein [Staphylococcus simiae]MBO1212090.1 VOC family protein [Staphylococcus simiae]MBO1230722.1 VOC family protein [Staphylococcus simiae]
MFHSNTAHFVNGVTLNVKDKNELKPFYENVLGLNIINETLTSIQYEVGQSNHIIKLEEIEHGREPLLSEAGLFHIAIKLPTYTDLADLLVQLSEYDIPVNGGNQSTSLSLFFEDPDGHGFKFYVDKPSEEWITHHDLIQIYVKPLNVPKLLNYASDEQWQGIPDLAIIGSLHIKTIRLSEVTNYYCDYFGLDIAAYMDDFSLFLASQGYHQHLAMNQWMSATKRIDNFNSYGLAIVDFHYPETTHLNLQGPDGIYYRFNKIKTVD